MYTFKDGYRESNPLPNNDIKEDNFDWDVHTETHLSATFESEFMLENFDLHRSRSLPTMLIESEEEDESGSTEEFNTTVSRPVIKRVTDISGGI